MKKESKDINDFISLFEVVSPPILLSDETQNELVNVTKPMPEDYISSFISQWEGDLDEYTEIVPCFSLPKTDNYTAIVYWKASLMKYEYIIVTLSPTYDLIARKVICSTIVEDQIIKKSAAKIDEDNIIHITAGAALDGDEYNPENGQFFYIELMESGDLLFHIDNQRADYEA